MRYADDLAYVHHTGFADLARGAARFVVEELLPRAGITEGTVVDLGCGSGIVLRALQDAGYRAAGVDLSPAMVALAKKAAPRAKLVCASLYDVDLRALAPGGCAAVLAVGEPLSYGDEPLAPLFRRVRAALADGGVFTFDVIVDGPGPPLTRRAWMAGADWACLVDTVEDARRTSLSRDITTFRAARSTAPAGRRTTLYERAREVHHVRVLRRRDVERMLRAAGFRVRVLTRYGAHPLAVRRRAFLCTAAGRRGRR